MFKKILVAVLILIVVAAVVAAIALRPYYQMPPESKSELDAKLSEYQSIANEMASRPQQDRKALDALLGDMDAKLDKKGETLWQKTCPAYSIDFLDSKQPYIDKIMGFEERFASLLEDGLVVQHDGAFTADFPNFYNLRNFAYAQLATSVRDVREGRSDRALERFAVVTGIIEGLERVPSLLFVLMGNGVEIKFNDAIVYLLPSLSEDVVDKLRSKIAGLPDARAMLIEGMKTESAAFVNQMDRLQTENVAEVLDEDTSWNDQPRLLYLTRLAKITGFLKRERYMYLSLAGRQIRYIEKWLDEGAEGTPESLTIEDLRHSYVTMLGFPNLVNLINKTQEAMQRRQAVLTAMDLELKRRQTEQKPDIELPYGDDQKIVLTGEYGCITKIE